jgi:hypothetical protein
LTGEFDSSKLDAVQLIALIQFYQTVAGALGAAIDSKNPHVWRILPRQPHCAAA